MFLLLYDIFINRDNPCYHISLNTRILIVSLLVLESRKSTVLNLDLLCRIVTYPHRLFLPPGGIETNF